MIIYNGVTFENGVQAGNNVANFPTYKMSINQTAFLQYDTVILTINTTGVLDGTTFYWNVEGALLPGYFNVTSGAVRILNNTATITINVLNDLKSMPNAGMPNTFYIALRQQPSVGQPLVVSPKVIISASNIVAVGGSLSYNVGLYKYHIFASSGTFSVSYVPDGSSVEVVAIGGGGSGGSQGGGGGAGGVVVNRAVYIGATNYPVVIGAGGAGFVGGSSPGNNGADTTFNGLVALGGGAGGGGGGQSVASLAKGNDGGSGGGGGMFPGGAGLQPTSASGGYGNGGGQGQTGSSGFRPTGGGGGAGSAGGSWTGSAGGPGGTGISVDILTALNIGQNVGGVLYVAGGGYGVISGGSYGVTGAGSSSYGGGSDGNSGAAQQGLVVIRYRA